MLKRFGTTTLVIIVLGFGFASSSHVKTQATKTGGTRDLTQVLNGLEEQSYRAWQSKDTKFWSTFLSERFVGWG